MAERRRRQRTSHRARRGCGRRRLLHARLRPPHARFGAGRRAKSDPIPSRRRQPRTRAVIAAFSTSGPLASVALIQPDGELLFAGEETAQGRAGEACLNLLEQGFKQTGTSLGEVTLFAADLGPGSFTGVRVGIVLAKTFAWGQNAKCAGADAFDLVDPNGPVALPSRRGEWFVRTPGAEVERTRQQPDTVGIPKAKGFARLVERLNPISPYELVPAYLIEPSISTPKKPYSEIPR
ncbi:tRNA (adenosine(37)-N6)-threonylcarbamoyltransferase complex dimerization subunit type 1 TsaB [bacterium]|nr:MAG: tRNA (adenosine(37)-N6)-threonylcarbamoyltransferase complex dimerization subunit type 1 TsaB [bacterium]